MKKTKILTVLGVILAMGLTGCKTGNKSSSTDPAKSSNQPASQQSSQGGQSSQQQQGYVAPIHHWSTAETDPKVEADAEKGTVGYVVRTCTDHTGEKGIEIAAKSGKLVDGGKLKADSSFPDYMKLDKIGNGPGGGSIEYTFEYDSYATGTIFQRAVMDYWHDGSTDNQNRGYYSGKGDGETTGNFKLEVNGKAVDFSKFKDITYGDMLPEEKNTTGSNYSQLADCEIGEITLVKGLNTIKYTRLDSYNMVIKDFVLAIKDIAEWGPAQDVAADATAGTVAYKLYSHAVNGTKKIEVQLADSMLAEGSENKNDPAGYLKLKSNNQSFGFKFNYGSIAYGELFQRGVMDGWSSNKGKKLFSGGSNGADDFEIEINQQKLTVYPEQKAKTFEEAMPGEAAAEGLSALTDVVTGAVVLKNGVNEFKYTRIASYNLALTHIVFIVENTDHNHAAAENAEWQKDADYHWHICGHEGCNFVVDKAAHTWVDDESKTDVPSTCTTHGKHYVKCSVCGQTAEQELPFADHAWGEAQTKIGGATPYTCTVCNAKCYVLNFTDANSDGIHAAGKFSSGSASWNITGIDAGVYELYVCACTKSTSMGTQFGSRYYWNVDETKIEANTGTYGDYGFGTGEGTDYKWTTKSAANVTITDTSALFKMSFQSSGYSAYFNAVRLVKVAA